MNRGNISADSFCAVQRISLRKQIFDAGASRALFVFLSVVALLQSFASALVLATQLCAESANHGHGLYGRDNAARLRSAPKIIPAEERAALSREKKSSRSLIGQHGFPLLQFR